MSTPALVVSDLVKSYGGRRVVDGLSLSAQHGAITAVLGPNGAGKTTTIECCEGLRRQDAGSIRVLGHDPLTDGAQLRPLVGVMLQDGGLPTAAPAGDVLRHVARMYARPRDVGALAEHLGITDFATTSVRRLSGGQRQRLALACAVVGRPQVVFLDEPGAGLDPHARLVTWDLVRALRDDGTCIVMTTHHMDEAEQLADAVVVINDGAVVASGTVAELLTNDAASTVTFRAVPGLDVAAIAAAVTRAGEAPLLVETHPGGEYSIAGAADPERIAALTRWCAENDVLVHRLTVGAGTLDEVVLRLTGERS